MFELFFYQVTLIMYKANNIYQYQKDEHILIYHFIVIVQYYDI
jgi:hypothetical protein